eukprot:m.196795 g.196795  ORF g.196795 m.196795 type:complete len:870 (+) comp32636_c0_seq1:40-2649(+)
MTRTMLSALATIACALAAPAPDVNVMNDGGVPYQISNSQGSTSNWKGTPGTYDTNFHTNAKGPTEYFDVYGEVQTKYSQVYWTRNSPVQLPQVLVERFKGKVMAITGYEVDQVTHTGPEESKGVGGVLGGFSCYPDCSATDKSVPIYHAYNHHYFGWLLGADAEIYDRDTPTKLPNPTYTGVRDLPHDHAFPTNIVFKENPGGEFRKSYHGYPGGYAQLLHSPTNWNVEPMQIDTHNRKFQINEQEGYEEWFLPKAQQNNMTNRQNGMSPLIECPCSDRISKTVVEASTILTSGMCTKPITDPVSCTTAITDIVPTISASSTINDTTKPSGCLMIPDVGMDSFQAVYNMAPTSKTCASSPTPSSWTWKGPLNASEVNCAASASCLPSTPKYGCTGDFQGQCTWRSSEQALAMCGQYEECEAIFCSSAYSKELLCFGRSNTNVLASKVSSDQVWVKEYASGVKLEAETSLGGMVNISLKHDGVKANLTLSGPSSVWFGVGFNAEEMKDLPYAIIVDGSGGVVERKLIEHGPGSVLAASLTVVSNTVSQGVRTVVMTRAVEGATSDHYTFPKVAGDINMITAVGSTPALAYHAKRTGAKMTLIPTNVTSCVCDPVSSEFITYMNSSTEAFSVNCVDEPRSDMLRHGDGTGRFVQNSACKASTYHGGLRCCKHQEFLTDVEDDARIPNQTDTYFLKWRYYFQEYVPETPAAPASHQHLHHFVFLIDDAVNDYEEDNANYGTNSIGKITAHLTMGEIGLEDTPPTFTGITPLVMTPHCHAPSCIREEFWNADTGEIICNVTAKYGNEMYGSTNNTFNEANYVAIPPCIFGNQTGLQFPFTVTPATKITAIKYLNNSFRHLGQMAQWTGLMVYK